jgi:hypothetical protein
MNEGPLYSEHLYQQASADINALEKNVLDYPFSSFAGFLLLYHYKKTFHPGYEKLAIKTALQFNNPHWLQFQLSQTHKKAGQEIISQNLLQDEMEVSSELSNEVPTEISYEQDNVVVEEEIVEEKILEAQSFDIIPPSNEIESDTISDTLHEQNFQPEEEKKENQEVTVENNNFQNPSFIETELSVEEEEIAFEPLHTVDYFASQGIKITDQPITNDKLGNQMKSFTEWLKSMKRLHPGKLQEPNIATEKLIQSAAEESNINTEVLTEAMAEVLIKQDKKEKAIEMFSKLSLINPSKSAYFAAKIESIKSS